jgi:N-acetylglucosaminyl-diphospho-decaprenol L-rhamnosyltransferase
MPVAVAMVGFRNTGDILRCLETLGASAHRDFEVVICETAAPKPIAG